MTCTRERAMLFFWRRHYAVLTQKVTTNNYMSSRERERNTPLDKKLYEYLKRRMIGKPLNKLQRKYLNEKKRDFAPLFLDQLRPQMILYKRAIQANELPLPKYPEIAFIGRSNCGKSTLINELSGRTNKAKVSKTPGCTQVLHFYKIGKPCVLCLVDLPGYGFAECKEELRMQWNEFTLFYLKNRTNLKKVFVLIDCRVGLKNSDRELMFFFDRYNVPYQIILSKCDMLNTKDIAIKMQVLKKEVQIFRNIKGPIIALSALKKQNLEELRNEIAKYQLNKQIVKQNILMKVNDLIEQKRLKKLKQRKEEITNKKESTMDTSEEREETNTNTNTNHSIPQKKEILLKDETIEEALNRWNLHKATNPTDFNFNLNMNHHVKKLLEKIQHNFITNFVNKYSSKDIEVIDTTIEQQEEHANLNDSNVHKKKEIDIQKLHPLKNPFSQKVDNFQKKEEQKKGIGRKKKNKINSISNDQHDTYFVIEDVPLHKCYPDSSMDSIKNEEMQDAHLKNKFDDGIFNGTPETEENQKYRISSLIFRNENDEIKKEFLQSSLKRYKGSVERDTHMYYSENVQMGTLFNRKEEKVKEIYSLRENPSDKKRKSCNSSNKKEDVVLLEEEDTYTEEDYSAGLKKTSSQNNKSLYTFEFNLADKNTHAIYETNKSNAFKVFQKNKLENLCNDTTLSSFEDKGKDDISKTFIPDKEEKKTVATSSDLLHYKYIGLKSRNYRVTGTKKLKLFGKKKHKEIVNVPKDLATDYFKLPESNYIDKKKTSWNYVNSKYNKWLKKMKKKRIATETIVPVKKKDVMVRYVEKKKHIYIKQQNKLLRQKKKLGMITKPPKIKNVANRSHRNFTKSNEQKIFDREAFFKYRDVQK